MLQQFNADCLNLTLVWSVLILFPLTESWSYPCLNFIATWCWWCLAFSAAIFCKYDCARHIKRKMWSSSLGSCLCVTNVKPMIAALFGVFNCMCTALLCHFLIYQGSLPGLSGRILDLPVVSPQSISEPSDFLFPPFLVPHIFTFSAHLTLSLFFLLLFRKLFSRCVSR